MNSTQNTQNPSCHNNCILSNLTPSERMGFYDILDKAAHFYKVEQPASTQYSQPTGPSRLTMIIGAKNAIYVSPKAFFHLITTINYPFVSNN
ncbi:hypothetical protein [Photorhabdus antumapuensis]|uniref:hypothetical protein n=1 Tax=Photorhabdus antumapuensis TaxID=2862867 RepID=UPI001CEDB164|nr:hypothetical protein [Photorhabdus antumapuensis]MCA6221139.1 hypothetical protein [Photorhabdus antumapuensis]